MLVTKNQLTPLTSPKGHSTLTLTILDGHFSDQVDGDFDQDVVINMWTKSNLLFSKEEEKFARVTMFAL